MKKLILIVGILTQSYFGISQTFEIINQSNFWPEYNNGLHALTSDSKNNTYAISTNTITSECWLITYDSRTLEVTGKIKINLPETTYDEIKCSKYADGITYYKEKAPGLTRGFIRDNWCYSRVRPTGFEPVTLWTGTIRSNPTELRAHIY